MFTRNEVIDKKIVQRYPKMCEIRQLKDRLNVAENTIAPNVNNGQVVDDVSLIELSRSPRKYDQKNRQ